MVSEAEPQSLKETLLLHTQLNKQIDEATRNRTLSAEELQALKSRRLQIRGQITEGRFARKARITEVVLYPLSDDTLELVRVRLQRELDQLLAQSVNHTSRRYADKQNELNTAIRLLEKRQEEKEDQPKVVDFPEQGDLTNFSPIRPEVVRA